MASWLDEYRQIKVDMESAFNGSAPGVEQLIVYQELIYRIGVLETTKALCGSAHATTDTRPLVRHYQLVDAFLRCVVSERRFGLPADVKLKERRQTASDALTKVHADCRKRFASFRPVDENTYRESINQLINTVLPVWMQLRNAYTDIPRRKEAKA